MGSFISSIFKSPSDEELINCELTPYQIKCCQSIIDNNMYLIISNRINFQQQRTLFNEFQKAYNHPFLLSGVKNDILQKEKLKNPNSSNDDIFVKTSGKMIFLDKLLTTKVEEGHKILIISRFQQMTVLLNNYLSTKFPKTCLFDNTIRGKERQDIIDNFLNGSFDIFILCVDTVQEGINLTAADTIIIYESYLESHNYLNAINCCLRKNNKEVKIYRLITKQSFEPKLLDLIKINYSKESILLKQNIEFLLRFAFLYSYRNLIDISENDTKSPNFWVIFKNLYQNERKTKKSTNSEERPKRWSNSSQIFSTSPNNRFGSNPRKIGDYSPKNDCPTSGSSQKVSFSSPTKNFNQAVNDRFGSNPRKIGDYSPKSDWPTSQSSQKVYNNKPLQKNQTQETTKSIQNLVSHDHSQKVQLTSPKKPIFVDPLIPQVLRDFLNSNQETIMKIIKEKGPLVNSYQNEDEEEEEELDELSFEPMKVYDVNGEIVELAFESDSYSVRSLNGKEVQRCFYNEIMNLYFVPIDGYNNCFAIMVLKNLYGKEAYLFIQRKFCKEIATYIGNKASLSNVYFKHVFTDGLLDTTPQYDVQLMKDERMREIPPPCFAEAA